MRVNVKYHGWLVEKLNRHSDDVHIEKQDISFINTLLPKLQSLSEAHKKYINLDFIKIAADGKIVHDCKELDFKSQIDIIPPISGG